MRVIKAFLLLVFAVALGLVIHNNWAWLTRTEPIVFFSYGYGGDAGDLAAQAMEYRLQTVPLPLWLYLISFLFIGAFFVAIGSLRDIYRARRDRKEALLELDDLRARHGMPPRNEQDLSFDGGDNG